MACTHALHSISVALVIACCTTSLAVAHDGQHEHSGGKDNAAITMAKPLPPSRPVVWSSYPMLNLAGKPEGLNTPIAASGLATTELTVVSPNRQTAPINLPLPAGSPGRWQVKPLEPGVGGLHWLTAREVGMAEIRRAASVISFPGKAPSPEHLFQDYEQGLDVRPLRIPERGGYREDSTWEFRARFDGLPQAGLTLVLATENGTTARFTTDSQGIAAITFPHDFDPKSINPEQGTARTRKGFVVATELERAGSKHVAAFNYVYSPNAMRERSLWWGIGFTGLGMFLALPLWRRKEKKHA